MDAIVRHEIHVDIWQPEQPYTMCLLPKPSSSPNSPPKRILLDFVFQTIHCYVFHPCDENIPSTSILEDPVLPFPATHEFFDAETLASPSNTTCQIITAKLTELLQGGRFVDYDEIVHQVSTFSRKACSDPSNAGKETIPIRVRIRVVHEKIIYERIQLVANAIANDDTMCGMVPSSKKSINDLSIKKLTSDDFKTHTSCVVCLENFVSGTEVTCMPCLHVFHQDCITNWLENSHYCPICRFQMPTKSEDEEEKEVDDDEHENEPITYEEEEVDGDDEDEVEYEYKDEDDNYYDFCEDEDENEDSCFEFPAENDGVDYCDIKYEYYNDYLLQMPVEEHEDEDQDEDECQCENNQLYHTRC